MARRMFSPKIVQSDAFLDMSLTAQALYFHLGMEADDDGFVNPRKMMRMIGAGDDDLRLLLAKRFLLPFDNGVIVIKHWKVNNLIRRDFYRSTQYLEQKSTLFIKKNGAYTLDSTQGNPIVNKMLTQDRIGKDIYIEENSEDERVTPASLKKIAAIKERLRKNKVI